LSTVWKNDLPDLDTATTKTNMVMRRIWRQEVIISSFCFFLSHSHLDSERIGKSIEQITGRKRTSDERDYARRCDSEIVSRPRSREVCYGGQDGGSLCLLRLGQHRVGPMIWKSHTISPPIAIIWNEN